MSRIETIAGMVEWLRTRALPTWATRGFDERRSCFHERLGADGEPLAVPHRSMVQARQIFVYAEACRHGWYPPGGDLAQRAMTALMRDFAERDGDQLAFRFATYGPHADAYDSYGHAFILLAIAALHKLAPAPILIERADAVMRTIDAAFVDPLHGGVFDTVPRRSDDKRQNPLMHLLEACIALEEAMPERGHGARAAELVALFQTRLRHASSGGVIEHFGRDWSRHRDAGLADLIEPGHLFEWIWLLDRHAATTGHDVTDIVAGLHRAAATGVTDRFLIVDALALPDLAIAVTDHRLWPHTEAIKATMVRHRQGDHMAAEMADGFAGALGRHFLDAPFAGGWIDRIDARGAPRVTEVPASSLYHLVLAGIDAEAALASAPVASTTAMR